jgi:hypothetical protein
MMAVSMSHENIDRPPRQWQYRLEARVDSAGAFVVDFAPMKARFRCDNCGRHVPLNHDTCPHCGRRFTAVVCPVCHFEGDTALFRNGCPRCGYEGGGEGRAAGPEVAGPRREFSSRFYGWASLVLLGLLVLLVALVLRR